ncbi:Hypothetical predicted protein [Cloeon dipterum]|uniref:Uncharacterized protein n=1 Tax=Cloeon dipterum TaxID=197152 RepID=A0A8S1D4V1_9INSE|nr:Hypothetical predicted protein [Cloeon dipterum]
MSVLEKDNLNLQLRIHFLEKRTLNLGNADGTEMKLLELWRTPSLKRCCGGRAARTLSPGDDQLLCLGDSGTDVMASTWRPRPWLALCLVGGTAWRHVPKTCASETRFWRCHRSRRLKRLDMLLRCAENVQGLRWAPQAANRRREAFNLAATACRKL